MTSNRAVRSKNVTIRIMGLAVIMSVDRADTMRRI